MDESPKSTRELNGWKEIAHHLRVSVRTAQKFEKEQGLPVCRRGGIKAPVYALPAQLDDWKVKQTAVAGDEPRQIVSIIEEPDSQNPGRRQWLRYLIAGGAGVLGISGLGLEAAKLWNLGHQPPTSYRVEGSTLIVKGKDNVELWRYTFPEQMVAELYGGVPTKCRFFDLDGDSRVETVFNYLSFIGNYVQSCLVCFNSSGKRLWTFVPGRTVTDNRGRGYAPPFSVSSFAVVQSRRSPSARIIVSCLHGWSFPCQAAVLDGRTGQVLSEYWHRGHLPLMAVADMDGDGEPEVLLGGVNDALEYKQATLVVFDWRSIAGATKDPKGVVYFKDMIPGTEKKVVFFPRTSLGKMEEFNRVIDVRLADGRVTVPVEETSSEPGGIVIYEFDFNLKPINVVLSTTIQKRFNEMQAHGVLPRESPYEIADRLMKQIVVIDNRQQ